MYNQKLREHNKYVTNITAVAVIGMHKDAVWSNINLEYYLNKMQPNIISVQETRKTETKGRRFFACHKAKIANIIWFIDYTLPIIFQENIGESERLPGYPRPERPTTSGNIMIGSYAEAL
eukprot:13559074-Ditylum_brightwellii.AAC.1